MSDAFLKLTGHPVEILAKAEIIGRPVMSNVSVFGFPVSPVQSSPCAFHLPSLLPTDEHMFHLLTKKNQSAETCFTHSSMRFRI